MNLETNGKASEIRAKNNYLAWRTEEKMLVLSSGIITHFREEKKDSKYRY